MHDSCNRLEIILKHLHPCREGSTRTTNLSFHNTFRVLDTGIINDPDASAFERKKPIRLDLRKSILQQTENANYPYTTILLLEHIFHVSKVMQARHIHLKFVESSGDTFVMFRTSQGLIPYSTINNRHWIFYLMVHATGSEEPKDAGEGEFRLEVLSDKDARMEYTVNIVYIEGGIKLTLSEIIM